MKVLLDTNAYAALFRGHLGVAARVRRAERVVVSAVVAGELLFGFRHERNREELDDFLASPYVAFLPVSMVTADRFGWIAAHAMESGADLIPFDRHFDYVDGIAWILPDERQPSQPEGSVELTLRQRKLEKCASEEPLDAWEV